MGFLRLAGRHLAGGFNVDTTRRRLNSFKTTASEIGYFFRKHPENVASGQNIDAIEKEEYRKRFRNLRLVSAATITVTVLLGYSALTASTSASSYLSMVCASLSSLYYFACCRMMFQARAVYLDWAERTSKTKFKVTWATFLIAAIKNPVVLLPVKIQQ